MGTKNGAKRHTHRYRKLPSQIWACGLPDCTHYMPTNMAEMVEGKQSICWSCNETMIMETKQLKMDKPICNSCILKAEGIGVDNADAILAFLKQAETKAATEVTDMDDEDGLY